MDQDARLGRHRILRPLGLGGIGEVCLTLDTKLNREVAMNVRPRSTLVEIWFQEFEERRIGEIIELRSARRGAGAGSSEWVSSSGRVRRREGSSGAVKKHAGIE